MTEYHRLSTSNQYFISGGQEGLYHSNVIGWLHLPTNNLDMETFTYACAVQDHSEGRILYPQLLNARARACEKAICETMLAFNEATAGEAPN